MFVEVYHVQQGLTLLFFFQRYPGGFKQLTAAQLHHKDPTAVSVINQYYFFKSLFRENSKISHIPPPHTFHTGFLLHDLTHILGD